MRTVWCNLSLRETQRGLLSFRLSNPSPHILKWMDSINRIIFIVIFFIRRGRHLWIFDTALFFSSRDETNCHCWKEGSTFLIFDHLLYFTVPVKGWAFKRVNCLCWSEHGYNNYTVVESWHHIFPKQWLLLPTPSEPRESLLVQSVCMHQAHGTWHIRNRLFSTGQVPNFETVVENFFTDGHPWSSKIICLELTIEFLLLASSHGLRYHQVPNPG